MAGLQTLYHDKGKNDDPRGRKRRKGWRVTMKTPGKEKPETFFLSVKKYQKIDAEQCKIIAASIEEAYKKRLPLDERTARRLDEYPYFKADLAKKGVIDLRNEMTLAELWNKYERANVDDWAPRTYEKKRLRIKRLLEYFNPEAIVAGMARKDAQGFRDWLDSQPIAGTTAAGYIQDAKALFNWAVENEIIDKSPFQFVKKGSMVNRKRDYYLEKDDFQKMLAVCPSQEWRVLLLLLRIQGVRRDEPLGLKWEHIDLEKREITIPSPKTARYKDKEKRTAPIRPSVFEALKELKEEQRRNGEKSPLVLPGIPKNYRPRLIRVIYEAGLKPWTKLIQNMRASAATDARNDFGVRFEAVTMGHSPDTADKHYIQLTPADIAAAKERDILTSL